MLCFGFVCDLYLLFFFVNFRGQSDVYCSAKPFIANGYPFDFDLANVTKRLRLSFKGESRVIRASVIPGGHDNFVNKESGGIETQSDEIGFGTLSAEIKPATSGFFHNDEYDLDRPTDGFASILDAIEDIRKGKVCFWWALAYWLDNCVCLVWDRIIR